MIILLLLTNRSYGQIYALPDGEYMDTTINADTGCKDYNSPLKAVKRNLTLTIKCAVEEETLIKTNAKQARITVPEYLRTLGVTCKIVTLFIHYTKTTS